MAASLLRVRLVTPICGRIDGRGVRPPPSGASSRPTCVDRADVGIAPQSRRLFAPDSGELTEAMQGEARVKLHRLCRRHLSLKDFRLMAGCVWVPYFAVLCRTLPYFAEVSSLSSLFSIPVNELAVMRSRVRTPPGPPLPLLN